MDEFISLWLHYQGRCTPPARRKACLHVDCACIFQVERTSKYIMEIMNAYIE